MKARKISYIKKPYVHANREPCCCGNPNCTDFEDRMKTLGIPLDEIVEVREVYELRHDE